MFQFHSFWVNCEAAKSICFALASIDGFRVVVIVQNRTFPNNTTSSSGIVARCRLVFSTYWYIPVCTADSTGMYLYVLIHTKYKSTYRSVPVCTRSKSCLLDTYSCTDLVLQHHGIHGTHTEYRFQPSYITNKTSLEKDQ